MTQMSGVVREDQSISFGQDFLNGYFKQKETDKSVV